MNKQEIRKTVTFQMVSEEARYLSMKLLNRIYVIESDNCIYNSLSFEKGNILAIYELGNELQFEIIN